MRHGMTFLAAIVLSTAGFISSAHAKFDAGQINVSFGNKDLVPDGKAVIGADGDKWNGPDGGTGDKTELTDTKGAKAEPTVTFASDGVWDAEDAGFIGTPFEKLMRHYLHSNNAAKVTIAGLTPGAKYDLYLYSASNADGRKTKFTVGTDSKTSTYAVDKKEFAEDVNYEKFSATADADGNLVITYEGVDGGEGNLNGFQITPTAK